MSDIYGKIEEYFSDVKYNVEEIKKMIDIDHKDIGHHVSDLSIANRFVKSIIRDLHSIIDISVKNSQKDENIINFSESIIYTFEYNVIRELRKYTDHSSKSWYKDGFIRYNSVIFRGSVFNLTEGWHKKQSKIFRKRGDVSYNKSLKKLRKQTMFSFIISVVNIFEIELKKNSIINE